MTKNEIIITAQSLGYFRAKKAEKKAEIFKEMMQLEGFDAEKENDYRETLESEVMRRHMVAQEKARKALEKQEKDAAKPLTGGVDDAGAHITELPAGVYVVTTAQNNTDIDAVMLAALQTYCSENNARLLVAKTTYNKNGFQTAEQFEDGIYYAPEIVPYLVDQQIRIDGKIDFVAQANVLPTAKNPLSGFEGITPAGIDIIIPAVKIALKCTASLKHSRGKILYSTGSITKRNYITRKAGAVAATEHNIGALVIDTRANGPAVVRQLELMPESAGFYDGESFYTAQGVIRTNGVKALQFGDIHAEKMTADNLQKIIREIGYFQPENVLLHDVMDFSSRNHHNVKDCAFMFAQTVANNTVEGDVKTVARIIDAIAQTGVNVHVIESNHDLAINTWLKNADFKADPVNALTYLQCMTALYTHIAAKTGADFNMLKYAYQAIGNGQYAENIVFHETDESVMMAGVEMGCHGHTGINGSRGSPAQFRTLGVPMNTGHTHTPSITGACYTAGVSGSLEMGYNIGPSSWQLANVVTYVNGQRQIIFM